MSRALITESYLTGVANAIRAKLGVQDTYTPPQMAAAIESIPTGGITPTGTKQITQNGTHDVTQYASANVNVQPNLQSKTATQNGTVTPDQGYDGLSSVVVNVSGGGNALPSDYQEVEYIQTTGIQYVQVDFPVSENDEIISKTMLLSIASGQSEAGFAGILITESGTNYFWELYYYVSSGSILIDAYPTTGDRPYMMSAVSGSGQTALNVQNTLVSKFTRVPEPKVLTSFLVGAYRTDRYPFAGRIYSFAVRRNGYKVVDLVPCYRKSDSVIGLFDLVRQVFYTNAGSGAFAKGPDVL